MSDRSLAQHYQCGSFFIYYVVRLFGARAIAYAVRKAKSKTIEGELMGPTLAGWQPPPGGNLEQ